MTPNDDLVILEVVVPRGWRDFLYAFPEWKDFGPWGEDSLAEMMRAIVKAEIEMILGEIWERNHKKVTEYRRRYGLTDLRY